MIRRVALVHVALVLALAAGPHAAWAKDVKIGELSIKVMPAAGQCELREDQPDEAKIVKLVRDGARGSEVLAPYADCQRLADIRRGQKTAPGDISDFATATFSINMQAPPDAVKQLCAMIRKNDGDHQNSLPGVEALLKGMKAGEPRSLGVMAEDEKACYSAWAQRTGNGSDMFVVTIGASFAIRGKIIRYYYTASNVPGTSATVTTLLAKHKIHVAAVLKANNL
jgi:hypothetical protein